MPPEIVQLISKHKRTKKRINSKTGKWEKPFYVCKKGFAECIVKKRGEKVTRHIPIKE